MHWPLIGPQQVQAPALASVANSTELYNNLETLFIQLLKLQTSYPFSIMYMIILFHACGFPSNLYIAGKFKASSITFCHHKDLILIPDWVKNGWSKGALVRLVLHDLNLYISQPKWLRSGKMNGQLCDAWDHQNPRMEMGIGEKYIIYRY